MKDMSIVTFRVLIVLLMVLVFIGSVLDGGARAL